MAVFANLHCITVKDASLWSTGNTNLIIQQSLVLFKHELCAKLQCWIIYLITAVILFPSLKSDVISIEKTGEHFRLVYDTKGRFAVHRITAEEAKVRGFSLA